MNKFCFALVLCLSLMSTDLGFANPDAKKEEECVLPPPYVGSAPFEKMKTLAGTWEGDNAMAPGGKMKVVYEVTSNGSAVVERLDPGTPHEMVSVYHDEKGKLAMTHYCAIGNQPKLKLVSASESQIALDFAKGNVINPKKEDHMHSLQIAFEGPDKVRQEWAGYQGGKPKKPMMVTLTRVKEAS